MKEIYYPFIGTLFDLIIIPLALLRYQINPIFILIYCLICFVSGWWVYLDAKKINFLWSRTIRHGKSSFGVMILWFLDFPIYLYRRNKFLSKNN